MANNILNKIHGSYEEAKSNWRALFSEVLEDNNFYSNQQWEKADLDVAYRRKAPTLNLNLVKKQVDVIYGFQSQNRSIMKAFPIDGGDTRVAEVYTRLLQWLMKDRNGGNIVNMAFKDCLKGGVGWLAPEVNFDVDLVSGDIEIKWEAPYNILPDPFFKEKDLSDANYIIRHKKLHKNQLKVMFPSKASEIDKSKSSFDNDGIRQELESPQDQGNMVLVLEFWERIYKQKKIIVSETGDFQVVENDEELEFLLQEQPDLTVITRKIPEIMLTIVIDEQVILYRGGNPFETTYFPFVPLFAYYDPSLKEWHYKIQGIIRPLKDAQREKNKRRSVLMQAINKMPQYGWKVEDGAIDDLNQLYRGDNIIQFNPNRVLQEIQPPPIPQGVMLLEQMAETDIPKIGANPDLIGGVQEKGAPGVAIQSRIKQGLLAHQEIFDNLNFAKRHLGRILLEMIAKNYSRIKIQRILGEDLEIVPRDLPKQVKQTAEQAEQLQAQLEQQKEQIDQDLQEMEEEGRELTEEEANAVEQQILQMEQQVNQAIQQAEALQEQLAVAQAEEQEFWSKFDITRNFNRFDIHVDETRDSPTFRVGAFQDAMQAVQFNVPIPPSSIVELMELPEDLKEKTLAGIEQQQQLQQQLAEIEKQKEATKIQLEMEKMQNTKEVELIKQGRDPQTGELLPGEKNV